MPQISLILAVLGSVAGGISALYWNRSAQVQVSPLWGELGP